MPTRDRINREELHRRLKEVEAAIKALQAEVDDLRAQIAMRGES